MKLSEANARVNELREKRDALHEQLHAVMADDEMPQGKAKAKIADLRAEIKAINAECYPLEVMRGKAGKLAKGETLKADEQELLDECVKLAGEAITLG